MMKIRSRNGFNGFATVVTAKEGAGVGLSKGAPGLDSQCTHFTSFLEEGSTHPPGPGSGASDVLEHQSFPALFYFLSSLTMRLLILHRMLETHTFLKANLQRGGDSLNSAC